MGAVAVRVSLAALGAARARRGGDGLGYSSTRAPRQQLPAPPSAAAWRRPPPRAAPARRTPGTDLHVSIAHLPDGQLTWTLRAPAEGGTDVLDRVEPVASKIKRIKPVGGIFH